MKKALILGIMLAIGFIGATQADYLFLETNQSWSGPVNQNLSSNVHFLDGSHHHKICLENQKRIEKLEAILDSAAIIIPSATHYKRNNSIDPGFNRNVDPFPNDQTWKRFEWDPNIDTW
ncbi:MAG: hypothetical protein GWN61_17285, partial [candidate division Zixibacteria bacterium]|nr:hypothetical protein [candidate division KSB1 bacterium]NIV07876.1 hypothetical protein [candidate division Zixibacteria bacterium]NIS23139.1 hypothetical protein [candidate division KSB1 bacterium]NIT70001.1 hypothetical protein [candidate division KSB1 bacterium]NIU23637.1 hypothetical protein [candidate division KSB1 bacterium]